MRRSGQAMTDLIWLGREPINLQGRRQESRYASLADVLLHRSATTLCAKNRKSQPPIYERLFNLSHHGCPWIRKFSERATLMLVMLRGQSRWRRC